MKNLRTIIGNGFDWLDNKWRMLPVKKQRRVTVLLLSGYILLTILVIGKVYSDLGKSHEGAIMEHIENPVIREKVRMMPQDKYFK